MRHACLLLLLVGVILAGLARACSAPEGKNTPRRPCRQESPEPAPVEDDVNWAVPDDSFIEADAPPEPEAVACHMKLNKDKGHPAIALAADRAVRSPPEEGLQDCSYFLKVSMTISQHDGPTGHCWKTWNELFKAALVSTTSREAATDDQALLQTSLGVLCKTVFYRTSPVISQ